VARVARRGRFPGSIQWRNGGFYPKLGIAQAIDRPANGFPGMSSGEFLHGDHTSRLTGWVSASRSFVETNGAVRADGLGS
jgi:hypothetical protein